ncbi:MAG: L,D-transpeptidase [Alphaproteobacteria bacterium]|nr:MAG: L,D-transpeptidase [Alphaproteobacteria bacterium]
MTAYLAPKGLIDLRNGILGAAVTAGLGFGMVAGSATPADAFLFGWQRDSRPTYYPQQDYSRPMFDLDRPARVSRPKHRPGPREPKVSPEFRAKAQGPLTLIVSLDKQELVLWANGEAVARSRVSTGTRANPTPTGVFSVIEKDRWHWSNLYDSAPMHFMHRITWSGLALHQGIVPNYPASHGCIRLPEAFVSQLWGVTRLGARVIIVRGEATPVEISHPRLFAPAKPAAPLISRLDPALLSPDSLRTLDTPLKMAQLTGLQTIAMTATDAPATEAPATAAPSNLKPGPVSVFVSRKDGKLYVRKGFTPVFDAPVTIDRPAEPLGTHVFTALAVDGEQVRWNVVSMPSSSRSAEPVPPAGAALDRIAIPQDARERIAALLSAGASLIVSDQGLGPETGKGTDFIVLTR